METRLRIEGLRTPQVGPLDLSLRPGECVAVSGASGAGKSCLLRAIADLDPAEGEVWLDGQARSQMGAPVWRKQVGLLPTESQWWRERAGDHFAATPAERDARKESVGRGTAGDSGSDESRAEVLVQALAGLGLEQEILERPVARLSSGERQRLAIVRMLQNQPKVLLLDEPTVSLDARNVARVEAVVASLRAEAGVAVLWVTHTAEQIARVAQKVLVLEAGKTPRVVR